MTTFKTFLKIVQKNLWLIIMYTVMLVLFTAVNSSAGKGQMDFSATKPDIVVYNRDDSNLSETFVEYIKQNAEVKEVSEEGDALNDALYYSDIDYVVYIEKGFGEKIAKGEDPEVEVKSNGSYDSYLSGVITSRFVKVAKSFAPSPEAGIALRTKTLLENETKVELNTTLDTKGLSSAEFFYNFMNYSILAGLVFAISYATIGFRRRMVKKRLNVSSTGYKKINRELLVCNAILATIMLSIYTILGIIVLGPNLVFSTNGLLMVLNSVVLMIFAVSFAFMLTNLVEKNNALLAIINIVSIGSSFMCGVFVPAEWMPDIVNAIAHIFPSFYYVDNNRIFSTLEKFDGEHLTPVFINFGIMIAFTVITIIVNNIVTKKKQKE
ncbi:ABC transporter permease [Candidatus Saccharibacteria bacterium]|nr:ABC transporter permease [Candidatus Saccharibacteria bacterium]